MPGATPQKFFITAIGTDCGKTLVAAIVCQALRADYWKPVQTGTERDTDTVRKLVSNDVRFFPERHWFSTPASPHYAARLEHQTILPEDFTLPQTEKTLVIEGAGGVLVPLNDQSFYVIDLALQFDAHVLLVVKMYLGCINHALLTVNELRRRNICIKGLVLNGTDTFDAEATLCSLTGIPVVLHLQEEPDITAETVSRYANLLML